MSQDASIKNHSSRRTSLRKPSITINNGDGAMIRSQSVGHSIMKNGKQVNHHTNGHVHYNDDESHNADEVPGTLSQPFLNEDDEHIHFQSSHRSISKCGTMSRPDILYQGSLYNIPNYRSTHDIRHDVDNYGSLRHIDQHSVNILENFKKKMA